MKMANLILGLVAISIAISQHAEAQALITRVYYGNDFENYFLRSAVLELSLEQNLAFQKRPLAVWKSSLRIYRYQSNESR
jgi:hypothetical protein